MALRKEEAASLFDPTKGLKFRIPTSFDDGSSVRPAVEWTRKPLDKRNTHSEPGWVEFSFGVVDSSPSFSSADNLAKPAEEDKMDLIF